VKKSPAKVKPPTKRKLSNPKIQPVYDIPKFHEAFPLTLELKDDKEKKVCYFQCQEHLDTYLSRHKLKKKDYKVSKTLPKNEEEA
jgi:hypothetical protein